MFDNREDAAHKLILKLPKAYENKKTVVIALPKGAAVMGKVIANYLGVPLDIIVLKKMGAPFNPELAIGVVGPKKTVVWNQEIIKKLGLTSLEKEKIKREKEEQREHLETILRSGKKKLNLKNKTIYLVDDGVATGATVMAARKYLLKESVDKIILITPVIAKDTFKRINKYFNKIIALRKPDVFFAVGQFYRVFPQVENREVVSLIK
ncbi:phosphoribosyltransferase [Patescibacteria group bacterium]|nr:phosphoribosyltransferase [Patescibacteria group bacterium]